MPDNEKILAVKKAFEQQLLKIPGVTGVAVGLKQKNGQPIQELAIAIFVEKKKNKGDLKPDEIIPEEIEGFKTDVIESGFAIKSDTYKGGTHVESEPNGAFSYGTLGCFAFTTDAVPKQVLLSNQHVLMEAQNETPIGGDVGPNICSICSYCCSTIIAKILKAKINPDVDAAIAELKTGTQWLAEIEEIGIVTGDHTVTLAEISDAANPYQVRKKGARTGLTQGKVTHIDLTGPITNHDGSIHMNAVDQLRIVAIGTFTRFSDGGDSGSAIVNTSGEVVGLLHADNRTNVSAGGHTIASHIAKVKTHLGITIATATALNQVQTAPNSGVQPLIAGGGPIVVPMNSGRIHTLLQERERIQTTPKGKKWLDIFEKHRPHIVWLVNNNKRVATIWHRNRGPAIINLLMQYIENRSQPFPATINELSFKACIKNIAAAFTQFNDNEEFLKDLKKAEKIFLTLDKTPYEDLYNRVVFTKTRKGEFKFAVTERHLG